jgi:hypothetical protein
MPSRASSSAIAHVSAWIAAFDAAYAAARPGISLPMIDEMLTMHPPEPCSTSFFPNARLM